MPGLQSKWATAETESKPIPEKQTRPSKPARDSHLNSRWADDSSAKTESKKNVPDRHEPSIEHKSPKASEHKSIEKPSKPHGKRPHAPKEVKKTQLPSPPQTAEKDGEMLDLAKSFASRIGVSEPKQDSQPPKDPGLKNHRRRRRSRGRSHDKNAEKPDAEAWEDVSGDEDDLFEDKLYEKGPMTDAAKSLALRIGAVQSQPKPKVDAPKEPKEEPKSRYLTPKQKKLLQEKIKQEKLREEEAEKERRLKEEVKAMFEEMDSGNTNWADIED